MQIFRYISIFLLALIGLTPSANADIESSSRKALLKLEKNVRFFQLENGIRVIFYRRGSAPVFGGVVSVRVGGVDEKKGHTGISHMLEHMAFKGTDTIGTEDYQREKILLGRLEELSEKYDQVGMLTPEEERERATLQEELQSIWVLGDFSDRYSAKGGVGMNATTGKEITRYFIRMPSKSLEFWCKMESDRIVKPVMRQFFRERDVVREERRMRYEDSPEGKLYELLLQKAFQTHTYKNPVIGYDDDIRFLTPQMVRDFHKKYYVGSNIVISLVGDVDPEKDIHTVQKYFGRIPAGSDLHRNIPEEPPVQSQREIVHRMDSKPLLAVAYPKPTFPHPDDPPISVLLEILTGSSVSPLYKKLVKEQRIATSVSFHEGPGVAYPNLMMFFLHPRSPATNIQLLRSFDTEIKRFQSRKISREELEIAKRSFAMDYLMHLRSNIGLATDFARSELLFGSWKTLLEWYELVMKVSPEDIERVAKQYLKPERRTVARLESLQK